MYRHFTIPNVSRYTLAFCCQIS